MITLTYRCRQILNKIIDAKQPLLIKELADDLQVSARAVKYDLDTIRLWLQEKNNPSIRLEARPNRGIWLNADKASISQLLCEVARGQAALFLSPDERVRILSLKMLVTDDYVTLSSLAEITGVSRNTIVGDLQEAERFLQGWNIRLERKIYHGLRIIASEADRRLVLAYIAQSFLSGSDMSQLIYCLVREDDVPPRIGQLITIFLLEYQDVELIYGAVRRAAKTARETTDIRLTERAILGLFVRLCIVVQRIRTNHMLQSSALKDLNSGDHPLYICIQNECAILADRLGLQIPEHEIRYIWLQWRQIFDNDNQSVSVQGQALPLTALTAQMIAGVSRLTGIPFIEDYELFDNLLLHISDRLAKYQQQVLEPNPMADDVIRIYSTMFRHVKQVCRELLGIAGIFLNDADTAYIVLHFQAAYERRFGRYKSRALIVCGTGRGSARLLKARLENEIKSLQVTGCCSVMELKKALQLYPVDLVISVLPVETGCPNVIINAIPTKKDIDAIHQALKKISQNNAADVPEIVLNKNTFLEALTEMRAGLDSRELPFLETLSQEIINQGFQVAALITARFKQHLTEQAAAGLTIHILLMVNRLAFNSPYINFAVDGQSDNKCSAMLRRQLTEVLHEHYPGLPDNEIAAILRYFS